ncbi:MAG: c-type cytochrome [Rhodocyclaceae bacterium]|nr:c-type cytochrome [Rhodocyclaceae bacterium]
MTCRLLSRFSVAALILFGQAALAADPVNGSRIYSMHCVVCHGVDGHAVMPNAPSFAAGDGLMQPDIMIANSIRGGKNVMPAFLGILREQEIRDVIAYLRTLNR